MGSRIIRRGEVTHTGPLLKSRYEDRDGIRTFTGSDYVIQVVVTVQDGPDQGREIRVEFDPEALAMHVDALMQARREVRRKNDDMQV